MKKFIVAGILLLGLWGGFAEVLASTPAYQVAAQSIPEDIYYWGDGKITSVGKREQTIQEASNAVYVITRDDIIQSGALKVEELFAFVPGVQLIYRNSNEPEVIIRGFPQQYSPRILVLVDGVSVYNPVTSGVSWSTLPITVDSIERIEVIRGPAPVLYGANAFSGVINIITRTPQDFKGVEAKAYGGNLGNYGAGVTALAKVGDFTHFRFSGEYHQDSGFGGDNGNEQLDSLKKGTLMADSFFTLGDKSKFRVGLWYQRADEDFPVNNFIPPFVLANNNLYTVGSFTTQLGKNHQFKIQSFFNKDESTGRGGQPTLGAIDLNKVDIQVEDIWHFNPQNYLIVGSNYRFNSVSGALFGPDRQDLHLASVYANDEFKINKYLTLDAGGRYEYDSFTKNNWSAQFALIGTPTPNHIFRAAVKRAVQTPSFLENKTNFSLSDQGVIINAVGNPNLGAQTVLAAELGYVGYFLHRKLRANVDGFFNDVHHLPLPVVTFQPPNIFNAVSAVDAGDTQVYGVEYGFRYRVFDWWDLAVDHTITRQRGVKAGESPNNMVNVVQTFRHPIGFSAHLAFNWTDRYQVFDVTGITNRPIDNLFRLDVRLAQKFLKDRLELAFVGQGLVDYPRVEFNQGLQTDRRIFGVLTYTYK